MNLSDLNASTLAMAAVSSLSQLAIQRTSLRLPLLRLLNQYVNASLDYEKLAVQKYARLQLMTIMKAAHLQDGDAEIHRLVAEVPELRSLLAYLSTGGRRGKRLPSSLDEDEVGAPEGGSMTGEEEEGGGGGGEGKKVKRARPWGEDMEEEELESEQEKPSLKPVVKEMVVLTSEQVNRLPVGLVTNIVLATLNAVSMSDFCRNILAQGVEEINTKLIQLQPAVIWRQRDPRRDDPRFSDIVQQMQQQLLVQEIPITEEKIEQVLPQVEEVI